MHLTDKLTHTARTILSSLTGILRSTKRITGHKRLALTLAVLLAVLGASAVFVSRRASAHGGLWTQAYTKVSMAAAAARGTRYVAGWFGATGAAGANDHAFGAGFAQPSLDFGDLPDTGAGTGPGNYETLLANNGPRHTIVPNLRIGATVDAEADGQPNSTATGDDVAGAPDDEDGINPPALTRLTTANVPVAVTNNTGVAATLYGRIDFDGDGLLELVERASVAVPNGFSGTVTLNFGVVPQSSVAATFARFRLSTDLAASSPNGAAADGEVEDVQVTIAPGIALCPVDPFTTNQVLTTTTTPVASTVTGPGILGGERDVVLVKKAGVAGLGVAFVVPSSPGTAAIGTDVTATSLTTVTYDGPDGDALTLNPTGLGGLNMSGGNPFYLEFGNDNNVGQMRETQITIRVFTDAVNWSTQTISLTQALNGNMFIPVVFSPAGFTAGAGAGANFANVGAIQLVVDTIDDALDVQIRNFLGPCSISRDFGDLPDTGAGTGAGNYETLLANGGPSHMIVPNLMMGATVDAETDGQPNATASGDDAAGDDEDGIASFPIFIAGAPATVNVTVNNTTGVAATLYGFIDWNNDGDFLDTGEAVTANVPNGTAGTIALNFNVPAGAVLGMNLGARFRLSTQAGLGANGAASDGEVEDYLIQAVGTPNIIIAKSEAAPTPTGPNTYNLVYTVTVTNTGSAAGNYNLDDTFQFGTGVTASGVPVVTYSGASTDTLGTVIIAGFTGAAPNTRIVTTEPIAASLTDVFTITVPVTVNLATATAASLDCNLVAPETGTGTRNTASLSGNATGSATACQPLPLITIAKSTATATPGAGVGQYQIVYTVTVTNTGSAAGNYNLDDTFQFGTGVSVTSVQPVTHSGTDPLGTTINAGFNGAGMTRIVTAEPIAGGLTDVYTITVNVTVNALTATPASVDCNLVAPETGTGLRNTATLGGNATGSATACQPLPLFSLGNRIWKDLNNSGTIDAADGPTPGVNGVVVRLLEAGTLTQVATTTTAGGGYYRFDNLISADYIVQVAASNFTAPGVLTGCVSSGPGGNDPDTDVDDSDDNGVGITPGANGIQSLPVSLGPASDAEPTNETDLGPGDPAEPNGGTNQTLDFGFVPTFTLGNRVWKDTDNSGTLNGAETGVNGVVLRLLTSPGLTQATDANGALVADQTTASNGYYRFDNILAGDYVIEVRSSNFTTPGVLTGCITSTGANGLVGATGPYEPAPDADVNPADSDDNGENAAGGTVRSKPVTLGPQPGSEPTNETDLGPGDPAEPNGSTNLTVDFGFTTPTNLGNLVWKDLNADGIRNTSNPNEPGISGVKVVLYGDNGNGVFSAATDTMLAMTNTDVNGAYSFGNILPGNYFVLIDQSNFGAGVLGACLSSPGNTGGNSDQDNTDHGVDNPNPGTGGVVSGIITLTDGGEPVNDGDGANGNLTIDFGFVVVVDLSLTKTVAGDPCNGATITYTLAIRNNGPSATTTTSTVTDVLPNGLTPLAASGAGWTCSINGQTVTCTNPGPIAVNATTTITLTVGIGYNISGPVTNTATAVYPGDPVPGNNSGSVTINVVNGLGVPGRPFENNGSSVLVYPIYTSNASSPNNQNTKINLTNIQTQKSICVHLFFVDGSNCSVADSTICLTPNQTTSFLASDLDPGTTGYIVAVAIDCNGCPTNFNFLVGDEFVKFSSGHRGNVIAEGVAALPGLPVCDNNSVTATLNFDGVQYGRFGRVLAVDNIGSRADGNDTMLIVDRIGGNLGIGASTLGTLFGILYNDTEAALSFNFAGACQLRASLTNNFPRTTPRFETFIPAGRSGWLKLFSQSDFALVGASINFNGNSGAQANAFNGAHNLHRLTLSSAGSYVVPVFPANGCQ